ncbi:MAG: HAD-IC family P-type ATPase, partial [Catalinimonas sp.]
ALPTFFYAGSDYLRAAWRGLQRKQLPLDVPIALGMVVLLGRSAWDVLRHVGPGYLDSLAGLVFFLLIGKWYQRHTYEALSYDRDYRSYFPMTSTRLEAHADGEREVPTPLDALRPGDRVLVRHGELIPADARLLNGEGRIDYSFVTGESEPIRKRAGEELFAGGRQQGSPLRLELRRAVAQSYLTSLWNQDAFRKPQDNRLKGLADGIGKHFTAVVLLIALGTAAYWAWRDPDTLPAAVTAVLIVACPCALALAAPFALGHTLRRFGRRGCYLKNAGVLERLARVDHLVFDKTGTLTHARARRVLFVGEPLSAEEAHWVRSAAHNSAHPLSQGLYEATKSGQPVTSPEAFEEIAGRGVVAEVAGRTVRLGSAAHCGVAAAPTDGTCVYVAIDGRARGHYAFEARYRSGTEALLVGLRRAYETHLLSGDDDRDAPRLRPYFGSLRFRQSPLDKLGYVQRLTEAGHRTLMIGDGLNDAGALKESDVGMALADDVYRFSPACDAILDAGQLSHLDRFLRLARASRRITLAAFGLSFLYNAVGLSFAVSGLLTPVVAAVLMPLSSVTVVGFVTAAVHLTDRRLFRS